MRYLHCGGGDNAKSAMTRRFDPFQFVLIALSGWINGRQLLLIDHLREENRVLREQLGERRLRFTDDQRRRLAAKAKGLGRKVLVELSTIVTPATLLAWHRRLIAQSTTAARNGSREDLGRRTRLRRWWCAWQRRTAAGGIGECRARSPIWDMRSVAAPSPTYWRETELSRRRRGNERLPGRSSSSSTGI